MYMFQFWSRLRDAILFFFRYSLIQKEKYAEVIAATEIEIEKLRIKFREAKTEQNNKDLVVKRVWWVFD